MGLEIYIAINHFLQEAAILHVDDGREATIAVETIYINGSSSSIEGSVPLSHILLILFRMVLLITKTKAGTAIDVLDKEEKEQGCDNTGRNGTHEERLTSFFQCIEVGRAGIEDTRIKIFIAAVISIVQRFEYRFLKSWIEEALVLADIQRGFAIAGIINEPRQE